MFSLPCTVTVPRKLVVSILFTLSGPRSAPHGTGPIPLYLLGSRSRRGCSSPPFSCGAIMSSLARPLSTHPTHTGIRTRSVGQPRQTANALSLRQKPQDDKGVCRAWFLEGIYLDVSKRLQSFKSPPCSQSFFVNEWPVGTWLASAVSNSLNFEQELLRTSAVDLRKGQPLCSGKHPV